MPSVPNLKAVESPTSRRQYHPGELISDKYRLVRTLGEGGMATVWVAENEPLNIHVAIKLIRSDHTSEAAATRLLQEARAGASIDHPSIIRVFDFGKTDGGDPFIVMELLDGECLSDLLHRRSRLGASKAVQTLLPIAEALAAAHAKGVVHRDLKPDNIFLHRSESGRTIPKILDFGIARLRGELSQKLTAAGSVLGSPAYMSPEQALGDEDVDHRADIWAFTVVLYEMITGKLPFEGANYNALLHAIVEKEHVPTTQLAAGDTPLRQIIDLGLCKDRDARWRSIRKMGAALAQWLVAAGNEEDIAGSNLRSTWLGPSGSGEHAILSIESVPDAVRKSIPDDWYDEPWQVEHPTGPRVATAAGLVVTADHPSSPTLKPISGRPGSPSDNGPSIDFHTTSIEPASLSQPDGLVRSSGSSRLTLAAGVVMGMGIMLSVGALWMVRSSRVDRSPSAPPIRATETTQPTQSPERPGLPAAPSSAPEATPSASADGAAVAAASATPDTKAGGARGAKGKPLASPADAGSKLPRSRTTVEGYDLKLPY